MTVSCHSYKCVWFLMKTLAAQIIATFEMLNGLQNRLLSLSRSKVYLPVVAFLSIIRTTCEDVGYSLASITILIIP